MLRSEVRIPYAPPKQYNPNLLPIGHGFGFIVFIEEVLFYKPNKPIAIVEAKDNNHSMSDGMQQALNYAQMMNVPFVFSSNGDGFVFHNRYIQEGERETVLPLDGFPSPETFGKCM